MNSPSFPESFADDVDLPLWLADDEGTIVRANRALLDLVGCDVGDLPTSLERLSGGVIPDSVWRQFVESDAFEWEYESSTKPSAPASMSLVASARRVVTTGEPTYFAGYLQDLSRVRTLQREIEHAGRLRAIGQLAGGVAHDLNNMLAPILSYASILRNEQHDPDDVREACDVIEEAARRASELTRQLLAFGRKDDTTESEFSGLDLVHGVVRLLKRTIEKNVELEVLQLSTRDALRGDEGQLQHALLNIALNARDALDDAGTLIFEIDSIHIDRASVDSWRLSPEPGMYVVIRVIDNGVGIDDSVKETMFEPFVTTKGDTGTGLGLPAVLSAISDHCGGIRVHSRNGTGTSFEIALPLATDQPIPTVDDLLPLSSEIWALDGDDNVLRAFERILQKAGYEVRTFTDRSAFLTELYGVQPRAVIVDLDTQKLGGRDVAREVAHLFPGLPFVGVTGRTTELEFGPDLKWTVLKKPFGASEVVESVQSIL